MIFIFGINNGVPYFFRKISSIRSVRMPLLEIFKNIPHQIRPIGGLSKMS